MIKSEYEILKLSTFNAQRFERNYSSCAGRSSENLYPSTGGTQVKNERQDQTQETIKIDYGSQKLIYQFCYVIAILKILKKNQITGHKTLDYFIKSKVL